MTKMISMAELKNKATQIVREVEMSRNEVIITKHAIPVAVIRSVTEEERKKMLEHEGANLLALVAPLVNKISAAIKTGDSKTGNSVEWIHEERR